MNAGKGSLSSAPGKRLRLYLAAQALWLGMVFLLGGWWGKLALRQAARIEELEKAAGMAADAARGEWARTHRMLFWESSTYFTLLLASTALLLWLYWRDTRRTRGLQAFFASVTHELRTPLASIRLQAESIADNLASDAGQKALVERLLEDTLRLEGQVERTLELARVEGGGPLFTQPVRLKPWLERFVGSWKQAYAERAEIGMSVPDVAIEADASAMQVILKNLLENSIRHSRRDRVAITLSARARAGAPHLELVYRDNGAGFAGDASRLGGIFQKGPGSQGAGVGLYLVKVLMRRMGGAARFAAAAGGGFEASLRFRAAAGEGVGNANVG